MESEEITEVIRKRPQASVEVSSKVHGNPSNQSIIYKQRSGISLKDKNASPDYAAGGEARTSKTSGRAVVVINRVRAAQVLTFRHRIDALPSFLSPAIILFKQCTSGEQRNEMVSNIPPLLPHARISLFSLKRQSKAIITTGASAKPQLF